MGTYGGASISLTHVAEILILFVNAELSIDGKGSNALF